MMLAPHTLTYSEPYPYKGDYKYLPQFVYNKNSEPRKIAGYIAALEDWQKHFQGDAFVFDYHMTNYHYFDPAYYGFTKVIVENIRRLPKLGLGGFVDCQIIRCYFPTTFPLHVFARILWNPQQDTDGIATEYFNTTFGQDGGLCLEYTKKLSELF